VVLEGLCRKASAEAEEYLQLWSLDVGAFGAPIVAEEEGGGADDDGEEGGGSGQEGEGARVDSGAGDTRELLGPNGGVG